MLEHGKGYFGPKVLEKFQKNLSIWYLTLV